MTDERIQMCPSCGHMAHVAGECPSELTGPYAECDCGYEPAPPKAAPSTDEGEARWNRGEESPDIVVWRAVGREVLPYVEMPKSLEAAISAPLEERIRALEAKQVAIDSNGHYCDGMAAAWSDAQAAFEHEQRALQAAEERIRERDYTVNLLEAEARQFRTIIGRERAEVERLREALRDTASHLNMASLVVDTALLPSPPSSTEGTKEVEG